MRALPLCLACADHPRFMAPGNPRMFLRAVELIGADVSGAGPDDAGVLPQDRVTKLSLRPASVADFRQLFLDSMTIW